MAQITDILVPLEHKFCSFTYCNYVMRPSVAHLVRLITKIRTRNIQNIVIHNNLIPLPSRYIAITFGRRMSKAHISFQKSMFNKEYLNMNDVTYWLEMLCHESTHIKQIEKYRFFVFGLLPYLIVSMYYYIKAKSHDKSVLEVEPMERQRHFMKFNNYLNKHIAPYTLAKLICDNSLSEKEKIQQINNYFNAFKQSLSEQHN